MSSDHWEIKREEYNQSDWSDKPSLFSQSAIEYFPKSGALLDLGAGLGQDSLFFAEKGFDVTSGDIVLGTKFAFPANVKRQHIDTGDSLDFPDETFDIVYSHLALHYFDKSTTERIFSEVYRVLKPGGTLAFLVNSMNDSEYNTGTKIEDDYFETEGARKRYFSAKTAREFAKDFDVVLCDENGETYKDRAKGVHNLVRFVGKK